MFVNFGVFICFLVRSRDKQEITRILTQSLRCFVSSKNKTKKFINFGVFICFLVRPWDKQEITRMLTQCVRCFAHAPISVFNSVLTFNRKELKIKQAYKMHRKKKTTCFLSRILDEDIIIAGSSSMCEKSSVILHYWQTQRQQLVSFLTT